MKRYAPAQRESRRPHELGYGTEAAPAPANSAGGDPQASSEFPGTNDQEITMRFAKIGSSLVVALMVPAAAHAAEISEASLRAADAEQVRIIVQADTRAQEAFMHPNYIINGPSNRVLRKAVLVEMLGQGRMASDRFERVIEGLSITGNIGIVMGREIVQPTATSELGERHGPTLLNRRFTNVFLFEGDQWRFLARQATIVSLEAKPEYRSRED
jgi:hypothetical protein